MVCVVSYEYRWQGQFLAQIGQGSLPGAQTHKEPPSRALCLCLGAAAEDTAQCSQGQSVQPDTLLLPGLPLSRIWGFSPLEITIIYKYCCSISKCSFAIATFSTSLAYLMALGWKGCREGPEGISQVGKENSELHPRVRQTLLAQGWELQPPS